VARVHCVDCGTDVAVDPLGQCPEGHLLPATGTRVSTAIGSAEPYPDEPVPWVGQVVLEEPTAAVVAERTAQPSAAPGLAPAQRETDPGDLLRELGDLSSDAPAASSPAPSAPPPAAPPVPATPSTMAMASATSPPPTTNGHGASNGHAASNGHTAAGNGHAPASADLTELSALEQAILSLETGSARTEAPAPQTGPATDVDDDLGRLFDDLDGLGDTTPAPAAPTTPAPTQSPTDFRAPVPPPPAVGAPPAPSAAPRARRSSAQPAQADSPQPQYQALADVADLAAANGDRPAAPETAATETPAPPARPAIDTMNFTAKGGPTKGRRRRFLGR
jgi:hypothetical protein